MASTYSLRLRFELPTTGEQSGTWGTTMDYFIGTLLEDAIAGMSSIVLADANHTLTTASGSSDQARFAALSFSGALTATRTITVPSTTKHYLVQNTTGQSLLIKTAAGTGVTVEAGRLQAVWCNGTNVYAAGAQINYATGALAPAVLGVTGAASIGGTLGITGAVTCSTTLGVTGASTFTGLATAQGGIVSGVQNGAHPAAQLFAPAGSAMAAVFRGRNADSVSIAGFYSPDGSTEYARIRGEFNALSMWTGSAADKRILTADASGNVGLGLPAGAANTTLYGEVVAYRPNENGGNAGVLWLNIGKTAYVYWDGSNLNLAAPSGNARVNGNAIWHAGNFNPAGYATLNSPALTGAPTAAGRFMSAAAADASIGVWSTGGGYASGMLINTSNTFHLCQMDGSGSYSSSRMYLDASNNLVVLGNVTANSDRRLKQDFRPLDGAAAILRGLRQAVSRFRWKDRPDQSEQIGLIAQDVQAVLPEAVLQGEDGILNVADRPIVAALIEQVNVLMDRVAVLEARANG